MISLTLPRNWLRTLMAWMDMKEVLLELHAKQWGEGQTAQRTPCTGRRRPSGLAAGGKSPRRAAAARGPESLSSIWREQLGRFAPARPGDAHALIERDAAVLDQDHAVGQRHGLLHVVRDQQAR